MTSRRLGLLGVACFALCGCHSRDLNVPSDGLDGSSDTAASDAAPGGLDAPPAGDASNPCTPPAVWSTVPAPTSQGLWSVWGASQARVWAVGSYGTIIHYDGSKWEAVPTAEVSCISDQDVPS